MKSSQIAQRQEAARFPAARLVYLPALTDGDGEPRVGLEVPPQLGALSRRPALAVFASVGAALVAKRQLEGRH